MQSRFDPHSYFQFRHEYPARIFEPLRSRSSTSDRVLDLGAGTGFVSSSFLKFHPTSRLTLVEPDEKMLAVARDFLSTQNRVDSFIQARAEKVPLDNESVDMILIGSAWHWMNHSETVAEIVRVCRPGGALLIFEYQFPKAIAPYEGLNEWIRRQFNLNWKAPLQSPRGSLYEITERLRQCSELSQICDLRFSEDRMHGADFLCGSIFSQSRFQHYLHSLPKDRHEAICQEVGLQILEHFGANSEIPFRYSYEAFLFRKRLA